MKKYLTLFFLFMSVSFFGQEYYKITYNIYNNTAIPNTLNAYLLFNIKTNQTIYKEDYTTQKQLNEEVNGEKKLLIKPKAGIDKYFIISNDTIQELKLLGNVYVNVIDVNKGQDWKISNETKTINNYKAIKATCNFRGRNWEAWFTPDISFFSGPWKFRGLPGLILQINDETKKYVYNIEKIETIYDTNIINEVSDLNKKNLKKLTVKQFIIEDEEARTNAFNAVFEGRGTYTRKKAPRNGIELIYEWEEQVTK